MDDPRWNRHRRRLWLRHLDQQLLAMRLSCQVQRHPPRGDIVNARRQRRANLALLRQRTDLDIHLERQSRLAAPLGLGLQAPAKALQDDGSQLAEQLLRLAAAATEWL